MDELDETTIPDERLELLFTCCHPALAMEAQVALTLRALGGLSTEEIARAFLTSPETMKRRLSRAKVKIKAAGISSSASSRPPAPGAPRRRAGGALPDLQRGLTGPRRPRRGGDPAGGQVRWEPGRADEAESARIAAPDAAGTDARASGEVQGWRDQLSVPTEIAPLGISRARSICGRAGDRGFALRGRGAYLLQAAIALSRAPRRDLLSWNGIQLASDAVLGAP